MVSKFKSFGIIIEKYDYINNKSINDKDLLNYLKNNDVFEFWCFILHDKDVDSLGELKREHYHIILKCQNAYSKNTILNDIAKSLMINKNCITLTGILHFVESVKYLTHNECTDKYIYDELDLYTNDVQELYSILDNGVSVYDLDIDYIIDLVQRHYSLTSLYKELGMKYVRLYRPIINDIWKEKRRELRYE